jgi:ABC-type branched-subunit amino acid transport system ATPase component
VSAPSQTVLEFRNVFASYGGAVILRDVSFAVGAGETVGLVGRNGAGKSTTLMSVYGVPSVRGEILVNGVALARRPHVPAAHGVSLVPQGKRIFGNLSVEENILIGRASRRAGTWSLDAVYDLFPNLARGKSRPGTQLSGGEQQMLAIARALMAEPALLMLDEPTEGLAPVMIDAIVAALRAIQAAGTALLLVEQHIGMIQKLASRYLALRGGELVGEGPVERLNDREVQQLIAL